MKRVLLILLAAAFIFPFLGIAAFYGYENWAGSVAWQKAEAALAAKGEPLSIDALRPKAVPDNENMAAAPVFRQLFVFYSARRTELYGLRLPPPAPATAESGDSSVLVSLARRFQANFSGDSTAASRVILAGLEPMRPLLDAIQLAAERPEAVWPSNTSAALPRRCRFSARSSEPRRFSPRAAVVAVAGDQPANALSDFELITRLARDANQPSILAGCLAQQTMLGFAVDIVRDGLAQGVWSDDDLARIEAELSDFRPLTSFCESVRGERVLFLADPSMVSARAESLFRVVDFRSETSEWITSTLCRVAWNLRPSGWMNRDRATYSTFAQDWLGLVIHNDFVRPWALADWNKRMSAIRRNPVEFFRTPVTAIALATFMPVARSSAYMQTRIDLARLACAIERCKRATGSLPASLDSLAPRWIDRIPRDAVAGGRYFYRLGDPGRYLLYGKGWNARDDGGSSGNANGILGPSTADDWVWEAGPRWPQAARDDGPFLAEILEPAEAAGREMRGDLLHLRVAIVAVRAELASEAALLVAAPGSFIEGEVEGVDPRDARAQPANHPLGSRAILREDRAGQSVNGVVGLANRLLLSLEGIDHKHGAENFFLTILASGGTFTKTVGWRKFPLARASS